MEKNKTSQVVISKAAFWGGESCSDIQWHEDDGSYEIWKRVKNNLEVVTTADRFLFTTKKW